jgi:hypothetical protein
VVSGMHLDRRRNREKESEMTPKERKIHRRFRLLFGVKLSTWAACAP